jgi:hypothetical protein
MEILQADISLIWMFRLSSLALLLWLAVGVGVMVAKLVG